MSHEYYNSYRFVAYCIHQRIIMKNNNTFFKNKDKLKNSYFEEHN